MNIKKCKYMMAKNKAFLEFKLIKFNFFTAFIVLLACQALFGCIDSAISGEVNFLTTVATPINNASTLLFAQVEENNVSGVTREVPGSLARRNDQDTGWDEVSDEISYESAFRPSNHRGTPRFGISRQALQSTGGDSRDTHGSNFQIIAPVVSLPGRGIDLSLRLIYNSNLWHLQRNQIVYDIDRGWPASGWSLGFGKLVVSEGGNILFDADGTRHRLTRTPAGDQRFRGRSTQDGSFIDYEYWSRSGQITYASVRYPNGLEVQYRAQGTNQSVIYPTGIIDPSGNIVAIDYRNNTGPQIETVTDTLGRVIRFHYDSNQLLTAITGPANRVFVRLHYAYRELNPDFGRIRKDIPSGVWLIDAIYYPGTKEGYWFGDSDSYSSYGMIAKVSEQRQLRFSASSLNEQGDVRPNGVSGGGNPSAARNLDGRLEIAVRGADDNLYQQWQTAANNGWTTTWANFGNPRRVAGDPVIAQNADGRLERFVRATDNIVYHMCQISPNNGWIADWVPLGDQPMAGDAALALNAEGRLEAFARGADGWMYQTWQVRAPTECAPDRDWNNTWAQMGNQPMAGDPAVARNVEGRLEVAARGADDRLYLTWQVTPNGGWTNTWMPLGEERVVGNPALARHSDGRLEVLVRGTDGFIYRKWQRQSRQEAVQQCQQGCTEERISCLDSCRNLPNPPPGNPCAQICQPPYDACQRDCGNTIPDLRWTNDWAPVGTQRMVGDPVIVEGVNGRLWAFARGVDGRMYRIRQTDPSSGNRGRRNWEEVWTSLGSEQMFGDPSAVLNADGRLEVFALGTDGQVHQVWQTGPDGGWTPEWAPLAGPEIAGERLVTRERTYNYPLGPAGLSGPPTYTAMTETWARMDTPPVTTRYAVEDLTGDSSGRQRVTITYADGTTVAREIDNGNSPRAGLLLRETVANARSEGLLTTEYAWQDGDYESPRLEAIIERDTLGQSRRKEFRYGPQYNQLSDVFEYGYDGTLLRRSHTDYLSDSNYIERHIFNLPSSVAIYEGNNNGPVTLTEYRYDTYNEQTLVDAPGVIYHHPSYNPYSSPELFDPRTLQRGNLTQIVRYADAANRAGPVTEIRRYDITGNIISRSGTCCVEETTQFSRDYQYAYATELVQGDPNPASSARLVSSITYDLNTGLVRTTTDANSRQTRRDYNTESLRLEYIAYPPTEEPGDLYRSFDYFDYVEGDDLIVDESVAFRRNRYAGDLASRTRTRFNGLGLPWQVSSLVENRWNIVETRYDARGRVSQQSLPFAEGDPSPQWQRFEYDAAGRLTRRVAPDGTEVQRIFYNEPQRPEAVQGRPGQTVRTIDAWGRERWSRTDALGHLAEVVEPNPAGQGSVFEPGHASTRYYYNALDQLRELNHRGQWHGYLHDSLGRLIRQRLPEKNWTLNEAGQFIGSGRGGVFSDVFAYDTRGNLISHIDARGIRTIYDYRNDPLNRLQEIRYDTSGFGDASNPVVPASTARYYYVPTGDLTQLRAVITDEVSEEYSYNQRGLLSSKVIRWSNQQDRPAQIDYAYDVFDRLTDIRYPAQYGVSDAPRTALHLDFASGGPLSQLSINGESLARQFSYSPNGSIRELSVGAQGSSLTETYDYDRSYGLLSGQRVTRQGTALLDLSYRYARNGRVTDQVTGIVNILDASVLQNRSFDYDALGRLTSTYFGGQTQRDAWVQRYSYDIYGNRAQTRAFRCDATEGCPSVPSAELPADWRDGLDGLTYDPASNRITSPGFTYDAAGNLRRAQRQSGTWHNYQYDAAGRLVVVTDDRDTVLERVRYGDSRQRAWVESRIPGSEAIRTTHFAWSGNQVLTEFATEPASGNQMSWARNYTYLGDRLLATLTPAGTRFHHPDRLGTRLITDVNGSVVSEQSPFAFGTERETPPAGSSPRRFTSYERSEATGLDYAVNRYYDPAQGRFTQVDPLGFSAASLGDPQSLNMYAYTGNDPQNKTDLMGLKYRETYTCAPVEGGEYCTLTGFWEPDMLVLPARFHGLGGGGGKDREHPLERQARVRYENEVPRNKGPLPSRPLKRFDSVQKDRCIARGGIGLGASLSFSGFFCPRGFCNAIDIAVGSYDSPQEGAMFFLSIGGALAGRTLGERGIEPSLGFGASSGMAAGIFVSDAQNAQDFEEFARVGTGGLGPISGSYARTPSGRSTFAIGPSASIGGGGATYNTYTITSSAAQTFREWFRGCQ